MDVKRIAKAVGSASWSAIKEMIKRANEYKSAREFGEMFDKNPGKLIHGLAQQIDSNRNDIRRLRSWFDDSRFSGGVPEVEIETVRGYHWGIPQYETGGSAAFDLRWFDPDWEIDKELPISSGDPKLLPTGIMVKIPRGYHGRVSLRSCMWDRGLVMPNGVGVIDSDYRGEINIPVASLPGPKSYIHNGQRIAQMAIVPSPQANLTTVDSLDGTERGNGGFGSTGEA